MFRPRSPVLTVSLSGLLLVFACGILYRANRRGGVDNGSFSQQWFCTHRHSATASTLGASDNSAVGDNIGVGQHRDLLVVDDGGGGVDDDEECRARLAFLIMSSGDDIFKLELLLPEIYHPDNIYLVHVDSKTPQDQTDRIREVVENNFPAVDGKPPNGRMMEPAGIVSWGGFSITLACLYGIAAALLWDPGWDYFINISASDFPVMTQDEIRLFLGAHADSGVSFMEGTRMIGFERRWQGYTEDQGMQRQAGDHTAIAMATLGGIRRPYPQRFRLYKGEFWVVLHRSFCEYASWSPDNVARTLSAYFTGFRISDESYFQTLACHREGKAFPIHGDNFRFASWNEHGKDSLGRKVDAKGEILIHPEPLNLGTLDKIKSSGALFARKFDYAKSQQVYVAMQDDLRRGERSGVRLDNARARFRLRASDKKGREGFCDRTALPRRDLLEKGAQQ